MKLEDREALKAEISKLSFTENAKERMIRALSEEPEETAAIKRRGKIAFRVALIAAALTLLLGVGALASNLTNLKDGATYAELADSAVSVETAVIPAETQPDSNGNTKEYEYRRIYADENEKMTQESVLNRMLNAIDYYDYASVEFTLQDYLPKEDITKIYYVTNDVDLISSRSYSTSKSEDGLTDLAQYSNGKASWRLNLQTKSVTYEGAPIHRMTLDEYTKFVEDFPVYYVDEEGNEGWNNRTDWPNTYYSSSCLMPNQIAINLLGDTKDWWLEEESNYLGRKCVNITVATVSDYYQEKWDTTHFVMCVDKLTGILLEMKGFDDEEILRKAVIVSEITIDDPEYTNARIDAGIKHAEALKHEFIYGKSE